MTEAGIGNLELPLGGVGGRLRSAREAAGLSRSDVAARTKIAERHLAAIEDGRFAALASRTYAVGFARTYARTLGLDEEAIANEVREELGAVELGADGNANPAYDPGDPSRIPDRRLAWGAALAAFLVVVAVWFIWPSHYRPAISLPSLLRDEPSPARPLPTAPVPTASMPVAAVPPASVSVPTPAAGQIAAAPRPTGTRPSPVSEATPTGHSTASVPARPDTPASQPSETPQASTILE